MKLKKPIGIFLCGGGAFGSWQSGVLKKLVENGVDADVVAGFSIGALNGAAYCFDKTAELKDIWSKVDNGKMFRLSPSYHHMPIEIYQHYDTDSIFSRLKFTFENRLSRMTLFSNTPLYEILYNWLGKSDLIFHKNVKFHIITHCVERKLPYIITYDGKTASNPVKFIHALVASCAIPLVFPPVKIVEGDEKLHLVDGGAIGIATINLSIFEGCKTIIMISNSADEDLHYQREGFMGYFEGKVRRMLALHVKKIYESRDFVKSSPEVHLLKPEKAPPMGIIDFESEKCLKTFEEGEDAALRFIKKFK
ncbi:MAG: hypothetical protein COT17_04205 [Elusimicrobia bacterium CG08_land_8_20_14_0_20_51_18]|nr:MAG: hypothetical protein COT17_04205 [Elusimicrobia bacterium CG08_land_8_20_14_0_20_51_18]